MSNLLKTSTVMKISRVTRMIPPDTIPFDCVDESATDDDDVHSSHVLYLAKDVWDEMGEPETITMTVVPGDALNEGDDGA